MEHVLVLSDDIEATRDFYCSVVGLRQTMNRLASIVIPPVMGAIADSWGVSQSFFILGAFMLLLCVPVALIIRRLGRLRPAADPSV